MPCSARAAQARCAAGRQEAVARSGSGRAGPGLSAGTEDQSQALTVPPIPISLLISHTHIGRMSHLRQVLFSIAGYHPNCTKGRDGKYDLDSPGHTARWEPKMGGGGVAEVIVMLAIFLGGVTGGALVIMSMAIKREDRRRSSLTGSALDPVARGTRVLTGLGSRD